MAKCDKCRNRQKRNICKICHEYDCYEPRIVATNADRIRQMDDLELQKFMRAIKCLTLSGSGECGYPSCNSMNGNYCNNIENWVDEDILMWLKTKIVM